MVVGPEDVLCSIVQEAISKHLAPSGRTLADATLLTHNREVTDYEQLSYAVVDHLQTGSEDALQDLGKIDRSQSSMTMLLQLTISSGNL